MRTQAASRREDYIYTADGFLARTDTADAVCNPGTQPQPWESAPTVTWSAPPSTGTTRVTIGRDALGRIMHYKELGYGSFERTGIVYDRAGRETSETNITIRTDAGSYLMQTYTTNLTNGYTGGQLASQTQQNLKNGSDSAVADTYQSYGYAWWDGAMQSAISYDSDTGSSSNALWTTTYGFDASGHIATATIADGQQRTAGFVTDQAGMVIDRTEAKNSGNTTTAGNPRALHYLFGGLQLGTASNNSTDNTNYVASIATRLHVPPGTPSPFANGGSYGAPSYDFDQNYDAINGSSLGQASGGYTCQGGETLMTVAQAVWGDGALWYLLADANGLSGSTELTAGQTITVPNKVINRHNGADTFRPYDPNEALGDTSPTSAAKPPKGNKCGVFGQILVVIVSVAVTALVASLTGPGASILAQVVGKIGAAVAGNIVGQAFGLATGIQQGGFDFKAVGKTAVSALFSPGSTGNFGVDLITGVISNVATQGVEIAVGLQHKFDFAAVAAAGLSNAVGGRLGDAFEPAESLPADIAQRLVRGVAGAVVNASTRSVIDGTDFGDNIKAALPDIIGQTVGGIIADGIAGRLDYAANREPGEARRAQHPDSSGGYDPTVHQQAQPAAGSGAAGAPVAGLSRPMAVDLSYNTGPITRLPQIDLEQALGQVPMPGDIVVTASSRTATNADIAQYSARQKAAGLWGQPGDTMTGADGTKYLFRPSDGNWIPQNGTAPADVFLRSLGTSRNGASEANSYIAQSGADSIVGTLVSGFQPNYQTIPGLGVIDPQAMLGSGFDRFNTAYQLSSMAAVFTSMIDANPTMALPDLVAARDLALNRVLQIDGGIAIGALANPNFVQYNGKDYISVRAAYSDYSRDYAAMPRASELLPYMVRDQEEASIDRARNAQAEANASGLGMMPSDVIYSGVRGSGYKPSVANNVASRSGQIADSYVGMLGSVAAPLSARGEAPTSYSLIGSGPSSLRVLFPTGSAGSAHSLSNQLGRVGEAVSTEVTGLPQNTLRIPSASGAKEYRIPDHLEPLGRRYIAETKNVKYQTLTSQILDDMAYVNRSGYPGRVDVIIDRRTTISAPLLRQHLNPGSPIKIKATDLNRR